MFNLDLAGHYVYHLKLGGNVVYIGQSSKIIARLASHHKDSSKQFDSIKFVRCASKEDLNIKEFTDIIRHQPKLNKALPHLDFAMYETRVLSVNKYLEDAGIAFEKYDESTPDLQVKLNNDTYRLWKKKGKEKEFDAFKAQLLCMCRGLEDKGNG